MAKDAPNTPQGNPGHEVAIPNHVNARALPAERITEKPPQGVEFVPPDRNYEVLVARQSQEASRAAEQSTRRVQRIQPNLQAVIGVAKTPAEVAAPPTPEEIATIKARLTPTPKNGVPEVEPEVVTAARVLITKFRSLSSDWDQKIDVMKSERRMRDDQIVMSLMAYTLDSGQHMNIPLDHPFFMDGYKSGGSSFECLMCGTVQSRKYPGQPPLCAPPWDNEPKHCAERFRALTKDEQGELLSIAG